MFYDSSGNEWEPDDYYHEYYFDGNQSGYSRSQIARVDMEMKETKQEESAPDDVVGVVSSLFQQAATTVGSRFPFEAVELWAQRLGKKMSDEVQLAVMKASFPVDKGLVRRYAYLSRKTSGYDELSDLLSRPSQRMVKRQKDRYSVKDPIQIGFCLTGKIRQATAYNLERNEKEIVAAVFFDRQRVTSMLCSEHTDCSWCPHVVALMFYRMDNPEKVKYRLPVSDSIQLLSENEQKQLINILLAHRPLEMLAFAQETLDELLTRKDSSKVVSKGRDVQNTSLFNVPDLTAGGAVDDEGLWRVDDKEVCRISRAAFRDYSRLSRSVLQEMYEASSNTLLYALQESMDKSDSSISSMFDDDAIAENKATSYPAAKDVETVLQVIIDLTKIGERSAIAALTIITEEWLEALASDASGKEEKRMSSGQSSNGTNDITQILPPIQSQLPQRVKNVGFLSVTGPFSFPDKLAVCWRRAALESILDEDLVSFIRRKLIDLAQKLDNIVSLALINRGMKKHNPARYSLRSDTTLWDSLSGWNGFQHVADLLNPTVCNVFRALSKDAISVSTYPVLQCNSVTFEVLFTASYIVLCLMDRGMKEAAEMLAKLCILAVLAPIFSATRYDVDHSLKKELEPEARHDVLSVILQCHEEVSAFLWSDNRELLKSLNILFYAIQENTWAWSSKYTWNLAPWFNKSRATSSSQDEIDWMLEFVNLVAPPAVMLGLLCVVSATDVAYRSPIEQVALAREKNTILSVMLQHVSEMTDDMLQQICQLAPFLEQSISHLDAPSTALLLLYCSILLKSEPGDDREREERILLSATGAALKQQTIILVNLLNGVPCVDFRNYEPQCAASFFMALATYRQSDKDLSLVVRCVTESVLELLQEWNGKQAMSDKTATEPESNKLLRKQLTNDENASQLNFYLSDMVFIVSVLCGTNFSRLGNPYDGNRLLPRQLVLLQSPISEMMENVDIATSKQLICSLPSVITSKLNEMKRNESSLMRQTAVELLLFLLRVDAALGDKTRHRDSMLWLLQDVAAHLDAVSFLEVLISRNWNSVLTAEVLFISFLMRQEFQASFLLSKKRSASSAIAALKVIFIDCAAVLPMRYSSDLYQTACNLKIVDVVIADVLANDADLQQKLSHEFLFLLAQHSTGEATSAQRMQVGLVAVRRWHQHCSLPDKSPKLTSVMSERFPYSSDHVNAIAGCLRLASLAVLIDKQLLGQPNTDLQTIECNRVGSVNDLFTVTLQYWIDPVIASMILVEVCRMSQFCIENATLEETSHLKYEKNLSSSTHTLQQILPAQDEFMYSSNALVVFHKICTAVYVAEVLAQKCKTAIAEFLVYFKQLAANSDNPTKKFESKHGASLDRNPCIRDFIYLEFFSQVIPDDGFDFEILLLDLENGPESHHQLHHSYLSGGYNFQQVVERFKGFRAQRHQTGGTTTATNLTDGSDVVTFDFTRMPAFQQAMQMQARQFVFGSPNFYDFDDSDYGHTL